MIHKCRGYCELERKKFKDKWGYNDSEEHPDMMCPLHIHTTYSTPTLTTPENLKPLTVLTQ